MCVASKGPINVYPKNVETWRALPSSPKLHPARRGFSFLPNHFGPRGRANHAVVVVSDHCRPSLPSPSSSSLLPCPLSLGLPLLLSWS